MPEPSFTGNGATARRSDTRWLTLARQLGGYQNALAGSALPANNPRRSDPVAILRKKLLNAINGTSYEGT